MICCTVQSIDNRGPKIQDCDLELLKIRSYKTEHTFIKQRLSKYENFVQNQKNITFRLKEKITFNIFVISKDFIEVLLHSLIESVLYCLVHKYLRT